VSEKDLRKALIKKAVGYTVSEVTKEYIVNDDGEKRVVKEKESTKYIPPDTTALKTLMELDGVKDEFQNLSDEELERERQRLILELEKINPKKKIK